MGEAARILRGNGGPVLEITLDIVRRGRMSKEERIAAIISRSASEMAAILDTVRLENARLIASLSSRVDEGVERRRTAQEIISSIVARERKNPAPTHHFVRGENGGERRMDPY